MHNHQPRIPISTLPVHRVALWPGEQPQVACPHCGRWRMLHRKTIPRHHDDIDSPRRCPGSGQRILIDLDPDDWLAALWAAEADAKTRRAHGPHHRSPHAPVPPPIHHLATATC